MVFANNGEASMSEATQKTQVATVLSTKKLSSLKKKVSAILDKVPRKVDVPEWDRL